MANCEQAVWFSTVRRGGVDIEFATFSIGPQNPNGTFQGSFQIEGGSAEEIEITCTGVRISFVRPKNAPAFLYDGIFVSAGPVLFATGKRTRIGFPLEEIQKAFAESASQPDATLSEKEAEKLAARSFVAGLDLPDDWTGERT